jgi:hypothetical protein
MMIVVTGRQTLQGERGRGQGGESEVDSDVRSMKSQSFGVCPIGDHDRGSLISRLWYPGHENVLQLLLETSIYALALLIIIR